MNSEQFVNLVLQSAEHSLERESFEFLQQCSGFGVDYLASQEVSEFLSGLTDPTQNINICNLLTVYYVSAIIRENRESLYRDAVNHINSLKKLEIEMGSIEILFVNTVIDSIGFSSEESFSLGFEILNALDSANFNQNMQRFFERMKNWVVSNFNWDLNLLLYSKTIKRLNLKSEYLQMFVKSLQSLLLSLLNRSYKEKDINLFMKSQKAYIEAFSFDQELIAKYRSLISYKFLQITKKLSHFNQEFEEVCKKGERAIKENFLFYSATDNEEGYFQLINEAVHLNNIFELTGRSGITNMSVKKRNGKIDMKLEFQTSAQTLSTYFCEPLKYKASIFCLIFYKISEFLSNFQNFALDFCLNPSCIWLEGDGTVFLLPDQSFCVIRKEDHKDYFQLDAVSASYKLALLMQESLKFLDETQEVHEQLIQDIETIKTTPDLSLEQITQHLKSKSAIITS